MEEDGQETQSQHDPLLQQSHDDIREDLGGEEITDSDTIQQPGGDMEEDGQETQSQHDPLLQQSHDDIREDLGGEEITDSDTIQQPGGDMEEDGQETQSQHDPLLQQSHDDIREDLGGEEITDSDTIQQPGGDMEEDGQETQSHDMELPLEHNPHVCTNIVLEEAAEGRTDDIRGNSSTTEHPRTVTVSSSEEEEERQDHLIVLSHEYVICSAALASQMFSPTDGSLSSLIPKEALQKYSSVNQVTTSEDDSPASSAKADGDSKDLFSPHVESVSPAYVDLAREEFSSHAFEVPSSRGDSAAPVVLNQANCEPIICQATEGTSVGFQKMIINESQSEQNRSAGEGVDEGSEPICEGTITSTDLTSTCVDGPRMDTAHLVSDESPPTILEFFNPILIFGHSPEELGQYDFQVQSPQPSYSESITEQALNSSQTPLMEQGMSEDFSEHIHSGTQHNKHGPIRNLPHNSVTDDGSETGLFHTLRQKAAMDISGDSKMVSEENEGITLEESPAHEASSLSLVKKRTLTESLSNDETNVVPKQVFTKTSKLLQFAPVSPKSKSLPRQAAVSEEPKPSFPDADTVTTDTASLVRRPVCSQQPAGSTSGRCMVREQVEGVRLRAGSLEQGRPIHLLLKQHHDLGHPPLEKSSSWAGQSHVGLDEKQLGTATDSRSQEDLTSRNSNSRDWHRKAVRRPSSGFGVLQDEESKEDEDLSSSDPVTLREKNALDVSTSVKRRRSRLINSSRLLYQEYSDVVLTQEIQRQKRAETFTEDGEPSSPRMRRKPFSPQDSYLQRLSVSSNASLWQDIPMIRGSSVLLNMTRDEQKLQEAKFELIMSEASYLRSLNVAVDHFQHSPDLQALLTNQERQWLFSKLQEVQDVSSTFLFDLEEKFEDDMYTFNVCDVVLNHAADFRKVYLPYVTNQSYQDQTFQQLLTGNAKFRHVLEKLESDPMCQRLSLKSFLILPFQRITRLKLLVQNILKRTQLGSKEEAEATQAHNSLEKLIKDCNENIQRMRSTEELIFLSQKIQFECKIFPLISQSRRLVKHGELLALESSLSFKWKVTTRPIYLHLFNDCLLLSRPREGGRFIVFDHARASKVRGERYEMKLHAAHKNTFRLILLENNQGRNVQFLFSTETQSKKLRWISALSPLRKEKDLLTCHDYPQVQCLKPYKARENDEISLEKADVIMVTQESNDGWQEGVRLSDGDRGWFPQSHVEQISSRHVRLRNLKEEQRIQNAKANLLPSRKK
ncbi:rho guanine nucleotide exchange factor 5 isoform X1 [Microcaecilia unicolor]|uniref:Rho guanine nucleotide exchange factor 5 isoform X1 n=1 Tax=Microcaecilia unicolor TaxID=1415580 RepID=A0A6P7WSN8_9AMPH|nr:rho guanine nucleotide exchange factor 5 isoform X1 [Microcaecilia unicolor]